MAPTTNNRKLTSYLVEDDPSLRALMEAYLKSRGHTVESFCDGESAWEAIQLRCPDILFMDWMLPAMSGLELCRAVVAGCAGYRPVMVMVTARTDAESIEECIAAGADDYIQKPFTLPFLAIRSAIAERRARDRRAQQEDARALQEYTQFTAEAVDSIAAGVMLIDAETHVILQCNRFAADMIGRPVSDIVGRECHQFVCPRERNECPLENPGSALDSRKAVLLTTHGDRPVLKSARRVMYKGRSVLFESFVDISELMAAEQKLTKFAAEMESLAAARAEQLIHADRLALLGTMSAGLAHEIGNSLTLITPNAQLIEMYMGHLFPILQEALAGRPNEPKSRMAMDGVMSAITSIREGARRSGDILTSLKGYARRGKGERLPCRIAQCVDNALMLCHNSLKYGVSVTTDIPDTLPVLSANAQQIEQVLVNLVNNSAQAMDGKGSLRISAGVDADAVLIRIEDGGPGIPPENAAQIWEPFFTTKPSGIGTGLGLPICKGIITEHGGSIELVPSSLGGAAFAIRLPLVPPAK